MGVFHGLSSENGRHAVVVMPPAAEVPPVEVVAPPAAEAPPVPFAPPPPAFPPAGEQEERRRAKTDRPDHAKSPFIRWRRRKTSRAADYCKRCSRATPGQGLPYRVPAEVAAISCPSPHRRLRRLAAELGPNKFLPSASAGRSARSRKG